MISKSTKILLSSMLVGTLALGLVSCGNGTTAKTDLSFTAGKYTSSKEGRNGDITVEVEFSENSIVAVTIGEHGETAGIADPAIERIPEAIVTGQTLGIDSVTGATITSDAILEAVTDCVTQAGGDVETLKSNNSSNENKVGETIEKTVDIVVVGAGAAGLTAAVSASKAGANVLVIEKGSTSAVSNGANAGGPIAVGTQVQENEGEDLTIEELYGHMSDFGNGTINDSLLKKTLENTGETIDMFSDLGLTVTLRQDAYGVGFRARHGIKEKGIERTGVLEEVIKNNGGELMFETTGEKVILNDNGVVVGLEATKGDGTKVKINADAVLLATGGYLGSQEIIAEKFGNITVNPLGNTLSTGDGINMALEVGGREDKNWGIVANEFSAANSKAGQWVFDSNQNLRFGIYGGLLVNAEGNRFFNEEIMANEPLSGAESTLRQGKYYAVIDEAYYNSVIEKGIFETLGSPEEWVAGVRNLSASAPESRAHVKVLSEAKNQLDEAISQGWAFKADTLEELSEITGLENLVETVSKYNEYCANGKDEQFYKDSVFLTPVNQGPYYVFEYEASAWCTLGGVKVDDSLRVVNDDNEPILGLYAAGIDAGSLFTAPYYDNEGSALGLSFGSGTLSGKIMADYVNSKK